MKWEHLFAVCGSCERLRVSGDKRSHRYLIPYIQPFVFGVKQSSSAENGFKL